MRIDQLGSAMNSLMADLRELSGRIVEHMVLATDQAVVQATPVDTGLARSNWQVAVGSSPSGTIPPYAPGSKLGLAESGNASGAIAQARAAINLPKIAQGQTVFITNNVWYIGTLNNGHSPQSAAEFVERAIDSGIASIGAKAVN